MAMTDVIASDVLDGLVKDNTAFAELSMSGLGYHGDEGLYRMIFEELKKRGLGKDSQDKVSIPMHPKVRSLVLVFLSQILRPYGGNINARLSPATDVEHMIRGLSELVAAKSDSSPGPIVEFDLNTVTVDLGHMPEEEERNSMAGRTRLGIGAQWRSTVYESWWFRK